jgi:hypothetical protein
VQEEWSKRELERKFDAALFERTGLQPANVSPVVRQTHPEALQVFKDAYKALVQDLPETCDKRIHNSAERRAPEAKMSTKCQMPMSTDFTCIKTC